LGGMLQCYPRWIATQTLAFH